MCVYPFWTRTMIRMEKEKNEEKTTKILNERQSLVDGILLAYHDIKWDKLRTMLVSDKKKNKTKQQNWNGVGGWRSRRVSERASESQRDGSTL